MSAAPSSPPTSSGKGLALLGALAFVAALAAAAPASLIPALAGFERQGVAYRQATGGLWNGTIEGAAYGGAPLGDISFRVRPLALLAGRLAADIQLAEGGVVGRGRFAAGLGGGFTLREAEFTADLGAVRGYGFLGEPLAGTLRADIDVLAVSKNRCRRAQGEVWTDVLVRPARRFDGEGFALEGPLGCLDDDLSLTLTGDGAEGGARLALRFRPDMRYVLEAAVEPSHADLAEALALFGFEREDDVLTYGATGLILSAGS